MSAGAIAAPAERIVVVRSLDRLAPKVREALDAAMHDPAMMLLDATVYETERLHDTATIYYKRGRPPTKEYPRTVTNAPDETFTWHGFRLAADIIHRDKGWDMPESWFRAMATVCKQYCLKWGGDWKRPDFPHVQWGRCKASPSDEARRLLRVEGIESVWRAVGAL